MWRENLRDVQWLARSRLWRAKNPFLISEATRIMVSKYVDIREIRKHSTESAVTALPVCVDNARTEKSSL
ncbi:MAG: hypothetical protein P1V97_35680, partial [Planctomycetota bacterium]|nr:hypothetical protein [Planctomycetota bacterium]